MSKSFQQDALDYHQYPTPGKLSINITKSVNSQKDLSLAYSPGVAEPVRKISEDPNNAYKYTSKGNLVGVITNGTAVLGLGNVGPLASKPVMEGKSVLLKRYANIDSFDIEVDADSPQAFIDTVERISPTFGAINLEDIKGPECFIIEQELSDKLNIPIFHDDQHGTAIIIAAGLLNALEIQGKKLEEAKIVCMGAGAAGIASLKLLVHLGAKRQNIYVLDSQGVISTSRTNLPSYKFAFARDTEHKTLGDVMEGADVFIGLSVANILKPECLMSMNKNPIVFALANPDPEITPESAYVIRDDLIIATGRSDYPNQVNNVICFPYIFRGALDVRATKINQEMRVAAVHAIKELATEPVPDCVREAYGEDFTFGKNYIIPKPNDDRLLERVSVAVSKAAVETGVAQLNLDFLP